MDKAFLFSGFGLLLCGAFIDGSRSPLLPVLAHHFNVGYQQVSLFLVIGYFTSVASTQLLIPISRRVGTKKTALISAVLALGMACLSHFADSFALMILLGIIVAATCSSLGAMANVFVLKGTNHENRGRYMCVLHMMYGLGGQAGPLIVALLLAQGFSWHSVFVFAAIPTLLLGAVIMAKVPSDHPDHLPPEKKIIEPPFRWLSLGGLVVLISAIYVAGEVLASNWMVTFLVESRGLSVEQAAPYLSGFFWAIAATRGLCFLVHSQKAETRLMWGSLVAALVFFCSGLAGFEVGFSLAGSLGPFFPLMLTRMSRALPEQAESISIRVMAGMQLTLAVCNFGAGELVDVIGARHTYFLPAGFMVITLVLTALFLRHRPRASATPAFSKSASF